MAKISNERKNLTRLAGEFLVASRLTQHGYMIALQWGNTIDYDILVFDKRGKVAYLEVKTCAAHSQRWVLQKKYGFPNSESGPPSSQRFVCLVDVNCKASASQHPTIHTLPVSVVAKALNYAYNGRFSRSESFRLDFRSRPRGMTKQHVPRVGEQFNVDQYLDVFSMLGVGKLD